MHPRLPIVGIPCDHRMVGHHPFHMVGEKYIAAVRDGAGALPLLIPVLADPLPPDDILATVDGLLFTGSPSNVSPKRYDGPPPREGVLQDERRDATTLPLLESAIAAGVPTLCLCRGFQELNVAFGGTLLQHLEEAPGRLDHREDRDAPLDVQYGPAHEVQVAASGLLARLVPQTSFRVNSLHSQGIDRLARAPCRRDGARRHDRSGLHAAGKRLSPRRAVASRMALGRQRNFARDLFRLRRRAAQ